MSDWRTELNDEQKVKYEEWIKSYHAKNEFFVWLDEDTVHRNGNPFYGRSWDEHVQSCKRSGRDPYD